MNNKKDSRRNKEKLDCNKHFNVETVQEAEYRKKNPEFTTLGGLIYDSQPLQPFYGNFLSPNPVRFSNTDMKIINTPANNLSKPSYLQQIDQTYREISGVIKWDNEEMMDSQDEQFDQFEGSESISSSISQNEQQVNLARQQNQDNNPQESKVKDSQFPSKIDQLKEKSLKRVAPATPRSAAKTPNGRKVFCNCKKTKCLKLYCDCFRDGQTCGDGCNCQGCQNLPAYEDLRNNSMWTLMQRNPDAFKPKIQEEHHAKGCHCKKSHCQKKYCQCFQAGLKCGQYCKCDQCKNNEPCSELKKEQKLEMEHNRLTIKKEKKFNEWALS